MSDKAKATKYEAHIEIRVSVLFDDNGTDDLRDQAIEALEDGRWPGVSSMLRDADYSVVGQPAPLVKSHAQ